jgi:hypothetical protein
MTQSQRLALRLSEIRQALNELNGTEGALSEEQRGALDKLTAEYRDVETRHRAAIVTEADEAEERSADEGDEGDAEERERRELRARCSLGRWFEAAISGKAISGAEAELSQAAGARGDVPLELFQRERTTETRAVTPAPGTTNENLAPIVPALFDRSAAAWLGIEMPSVRTGDAGYPVLAGSLAGGPKAKSAAADEGEGRFVVSMAEPRRVTGSFRFTREDAARLVGMEAALRMNIEAVLADALDDQAINGSGSGDGTINGLLNILADPGAPAAGAETFARYVSAAAAHVDGLFAVDLAGLRQLVGVQSYGHMAGTFRANEDSMTAEGWLTSRTGGLRTSRRLAAPAGNIQQAIVRRANPLGDRVAVMPVWDSLEIIRDQYTSAPKGEIVVTGTVLVGDVVVLRPGAFRQESYRLAA